MTSEKRLGEGRGIHTRLKTKKSRWDIPPIQRMIGYRKDKTTSTEKEPAETREAGAKVNPTSKKEVRKYELKADS